MRAKLNQAGFEAVAVLVVLLVVAAVGFAGYKVLGSHKSADNSQQAAVTSTAKVPATIKTKADLTATSKALDQSGAQLDNDLNGSSLNSDLNAML